MIDIGIMLALQDAGIGEYGDNLYVNQSPIMGTGKVSDSEGIWVTSSGSTADADVYRDQVTISCRIKNSLTQDMVIARILEWVREFGNTACSLPLQPLLKTDPIRVIGVQDRSAATISAIDNEGRFVKALSFTCLYKLPTNLGDVS